MDSGDHLLEHIQGFLLVGDDGIGLGIGPEADTLAQVGHGVDVVHPIFIHHPQQHHTLHLAHDGGGELLFLLLVVGGGRGGEGLGNIGGGLFLQLLVAEGGVLPVQSLYLVYYGIYFLQLPVGIGAEQLVKYAHFTVPF